MCVRKCVQKLSFYAFVTQRSTHAYVRVLRACVRVYKKNVSFYVREAEAARVKKPRFLWKFSENAINLIDTSRMLQLIYV